MRTQRLAIALTAATASLTAVTVSAAPLVAGTQIGIDTGPTLSDAAGNNWNDFTAAGTDNTIHDLDGVNLDGVSVQLVGGGYNTAGEDNWVGLSTNGGSAPVEFVDSVTTDIVFNASSVIITGLDTGLTYDIFGVTQSVAGFDNRVDTLTVTGDVGYGSSGILRGTARTTGVFHTFLGVSPDGTGKIEIALSDPVANNPVVTGILINAVPEPSSLALLGLGGLLIARRRRS